MKRFLFLLAVIPMCASLSQATEPTLAGVEWELTRVGDTKVELKENPPFLLLTDEDNKIKGHTSCNSFFGTYEAEGDSLKFGPIVSTKMACPELRSTIETALLEALENTRKWAIANGGLIFKDEKGDTLATFRWVVETE
jgi:heat shock protein HslJ